MKILCFLYVLMMPVLLQVTGHSVEEDLRYNSLSYTELSMELLERVRDGQQTQELEYKLASVDPQVLLNDLDTSGERKAFWLNIYNAYVQIILLENPDLFKDRNAWFGYNFFTSPQVTIAGKKLSFDDIEHGIIRHSKIKLSMGYLDKAFVSEFEIKFRWDRVDPRIHFALNCGAESCPYIAIYDPDRVEQQLDITTRQYLKRTTDYHPDEQKAEVNRLMSWFRADFGGEEGTIRMLKKYDIIPGNADPDIFFKPYIWILDLGNYKEI